MKSPRYAVLVCMAALLGGLTSMPFGPAAAQDEATEKTDWKQGAWGHLSRYIGTYDYDAVLGDPAVDEKLSAMLGPEKDRLLTNLTVHTPIGFENDCLVLSGNAEKVGNMQKAYMNVCLYAGKINAVIYSKGTVSVYTALKKYEYLPMSLRQWIEHAKNPDSYLSRPDYVQIISQPQ